MAPVMLSDDNIMAAVKREKTEVRRQQILETTLKLLADYPLEALSTRRIAKEIGLSQPALFRHFRSRDALMLAVLADAQQQLGAVAEGALKTEGTALDCLLAVVTGLFEHVQAHPGLPRLLFGQALADSGELQLALRKVLSLQVNLISTLITDGQAEGLFDACVPPRDLATGLVGMIQGYILQWEVRGREAVLSEIAPAVVRLWCNGARAPQGRALVPASTPAPVVALAKLRTLDVRPILKGGEDPLQAILAELESTDGGVLQLQVPFLPKPLLALLHRRGCSVTSREDEGLYIIDIHGENLVIHDLTMLEAPEPMVRVLSAAEELTNTDAFVARLPRVPHPLMDELKQRNFFYETLESPNGQALILIRRPS